MEQDKSDLRKEAWKTGLQAVGLLAGILAGALAARGVAAAELELNGACANVCGATAVHAVAGLIAQARVPTRLASGPGSGAAPTLQRIAFDHPHAYAQALVQRQINHAGRR